MAGVQRRAPPLPPAGRVERRVEQPVHLGLEGAQLTERLPADDGHVPPPCSVESGCDLSYRQYKISVAVYQVCGARPDPLPERRQLPQLGVGEVAQEALAHAGQVRRARA